MRYAVQIGLVDRWMALAALACVVGCTSASTAGPDRAAADRAAAPAADAHEAPAEPADDAEVAAAADAEPTDAAADPVEATAVAEVGDAALDPETRKTAKPVVEEYAAGVPRVLLSAAHAKLCKVGVGDMMPTIELPKSGDGPANLEALAGAKATVVLFWSPDRWMARSAMGDLMRDAVAAYNADQVAVVGIAVDTPADEAEKAAADAGAKFTQLVDADGAAFAQVGENALPRIYVLDAQRRIAWFDIEYSEATRRELQQTLATLAGAER